MNTLSKVAIEEKNQLASESAYLVLFRIKLPRIEAPICIVRNTEDIEWNGSKWLNFPVELDEINEDSKGEVPSLVLKVSNVTRTIQGYASKGQGGAGGTVDVLVVNSKFLEDSNPLFEEEFSITQSYFDEIYANFTLGPSYPITARRPLFRYIKNHCPFEYGDVICGVLASTLGKYPECEKSLIACRERGNARRFGGEPAIPGGFYV